MRDQGSSFDASAFIVVAIQKEHCCLLFAPIHRKMRCLKVQSNLKRADCGKGKAKPAGRAIKGFPKKICKATIFWKEEIPAFKVRQRIYAAPHQMRKVSTSSRDLTRHVP
ncbi:MAG TPA: hypothetical protein IAB42_04295 [Candidatus Coproplasma avistercoris]|nr:hypothetical protein [Candidatus Coproplasma avistercoris]